MLTSNRGYENNDMGGEKMITYELEIYCNQRRNALLIPLIVKVIWVRELLTNLSWLFRKTTLIKLKPVKPENSILGHYTTIMKKEKL